MRAFLDAILSFISSESLTDDEFDSMSEELEQEYSVEVYEALQAILEAREGVSGQTDKLRYYFLARGVDVSSDEAHTPTSNIYLGDSLE